MIQASMLFKFVLLGAPFFTVQGQTPITSRSLRGSTSAMSKTSVNFSDKKSAGSFFLATPDPDFQDWGTRSSVSNKNTCDATSALAYLAKADSFISSEDGGIDFLNPGKLERALADEINSSLADKRAGYAYGRTRQLQNDLKGIFEALPKNPSGGLDHAATNYAVHRWFVRHRQWHLRTDETVDSLTPGEVLRARVPQQLQKLLEQKRGELGIGLRELAALVATIEHLVDGDMTERLKAAYVSNGLSYEKDSIDAKLAADAIMTLTARMISIRDRSGFGVGRYSAEEERERAQRTFTRFTELKAFVVDMLQTLSAKHGAITFKTAIDVAMEADRNFAEVLKDSCGEVRDIFSKLPDGNTGRVSLAHMHKAALDGAKKISESTSYLKKHSMLDESDPQDVRVFVPNVIYGPSNCVGGTSFLESCCPNACEALIEHVERGVLAPAGSPAELVALVNLHSLASDLDGGSVSPALRSRLEAMAAESGGVVTVHGHAFAEWLNLALPLHCPVPHAWEFVGDGTETEVQKTMREFNVDATEVIRATRGELQHDAMALNLPHVAKAVSA